MRLHLDWGEQHPDSAQNRSRRAQHYEMPSNGQ
jgi:hypothetical protein